MEFIYNRIETKTKDFEKREQMLDYIENSFSKKEKRKVSKPVICEDLEKESKCTIYYSTPGYSSDSRIKNSTIKSENDLSFSPLKKNLSKCLTYKTLEKYRLPEVFKLKHKGSYFSTFNSQRFLPSSINEKLFKVTRGLSITSFNKSGQAAILNPRASPYLKPENKIPI